MNKKHKGEEMKKFAYSVAALMALGSFASAGGMITEPEAAPAPVTVVSDSGPYIGLAYSAAKLKDDYVGDPATVDGYDEQLETDFDSIMIQAGYKFNQYVALEGRYWKAMSNGDSKYGDAPNGYGNYRFDVGVNDYDFEAWGIYVKPMYPVTEEVSVYALLGYAGTKIKSDNFTVDVLDLDDSGFSWGIGAAYSVTDSLSVFVDYVSLYDDSSWYDLSVGTQGTDNITVYTINVGVTYKF